MIPAVPKQNYKFHLSHIINSEPMGRDSFLYTAYYLKKKKTGQKYKQSAITSTRIIEENEILFG